MSPNRVHRGRPSRTSIRTPLAVLRPSDFRWFGLASGTRGICTRFDSRPLFAGWIEPRSCGPCVGMGSKRPVHFLPVHLHPYYRKRVGTDRGLCPIAEQASEQLISLPMFHGMCDHDVEDVITAVKDVVAPLASCGA